MYKMQQRAKGIISLINYNILKKTENWLDEDTERVPD